MILIMDGFVNYMGSVGLFDIFFKNIACRSKTKWWSKLYHRGEEWGINGKERRHFERGRRVAWRLTATARHIPAHASSTFFQCKEKKRHSSQGTFWVLANLPSQSYKRGVVVYWAFVIWLQLSFQNIFKLLFFFKCFEMILIMLVLKKIYYYFN